MSSNDQKRRLAASFVRNSGKNHGHSTARPGHRPYETNFATVHFLQAHLLPVGWEETMSYTMAFEDRIGRKWQMRFFLAIDERWAWYVTRSHGGYVEDTSFPDTASP